MAYPCEFGLCKGGFRGYFFLLPFLRVVHSRRNPRTFNTCAIPPRNPSTINTCTSVSFQTTYNPRSSHTCKPRFSQLHPLQHMRKKELRSARRHFGVRRLAAAFTAETRTPHGSFASNGLRRKSGSKLPHSKVPQDSHLEGGRYSGERAEGSLAAQTPLGMMGHEPRVTFHEPRTTSHAGNVLSRKLSTVDCQLWTVGCGL
jgi:hypothetical protein